MSRTRTRMPFTAKPGEMATRCHTTLERMHAERTTTHTTTARTRCLKRAAQDASKSKSASN